MNGPSSPLVHHRNGGLSDPHPVNRGVPDRGRPTGVSGNTSGSVTRKSNVRQGILGSEGRTAPEGSLSPPVKQVATNPAGPTGVSRGTTKAMDQVPSDSCASANCRTSKEVLSGTSGGVWPKRLMWTVSPPAHRPDTCTTVPGGPCVTSMAAPNPGSSPACAPTPAFPMATKAAAHRPTPALDRQPRTRFLITDFPSSIKSHASHADEESSSVPVSHAHDPSGP